MLRLKYLRENKLCQLQLENCTIHSTEIHHSGKKYSSKLWLDVSKFIACCSSCHRKIENSPALAKKIGIYNYTIKDNECPNDPCI